MRASFCLALVCLVAACGDNLEVGADTLSVSQGSVTVAAGDSTTVAATYTLDGLDIAATDATWISSNPATATVTGLGSTATITGVAQGSATITASGRGLTATVAVAVTGDLPTLVSIEVTPTDPTLAGGTTLQLVATGTFSDGSTDNVTTTATWSSDEDPVATVSPTGLVSGVTAGDASITATVGTVSGSTTVTVSDATLLSLEVTPVDPTVALGVDPQFTATGTFSDTSTQDLTTQVTWTSDAEAVATISAAGLAETLTTGTATITATMGAISDSSELTVSTATLVSIEITPDDPAVTLGQTQQLTATGTFSDGSTDDLTDQVTWSSSVDTIASISDTLPTKGLVTTVAVGTTIITATLGSVSDTTQLTVTDAFLVSIEIQPGGATAVLGSTQQFTATGLFSGGGTADITTQVVWGSTNDSVAAVSNDPGFQGLASTFNTGDTEISATLDGITGTTTFTVIGPTLMSIDVTPLDISVSAGQTQQYTAIGTYSDGSTPDITGLVQWLSSDEAIATISSTGLATSLAIGTTTITALLDGVSGSSGFLVTAATVVSIEVTPATATRAVGATIQYTATGTLTDGSTTDLTTQVAWVASPGGIAAFSAAPGSEGLATATAPGTASITASQPGITSPAATLIVAAPPSVVATTPADGALGVASSTSIAITFSEAMDPASLTAQITGGACTGSIQLSVNDFTSCLAFTSAVPLMSGGDTVATLVPAVTLGTAVTYKIRVTATAASAGGATLGTAYTQLTGFTTASGPCATSVVISQVYGGGGNSGAPFTADFVELHNGGTAPVAIGGWAIQYGSSSGTTWQVASLPAATTIAAGSYFLVQISTAGATGAPLPTPDHTAAPAIAMSASAGKIALTSSTTALAGACPTGGALVDLVGYGGANCAETTPTGGLANATAAIRNGGGCTDSDNNLANFSVLAPAPRNTGSPAQVCACAVNESGLASELDFCNLQFPPTITATAGGAATDVFERAFETGVTEAAGASATLIAQIGVGPTGVSPLSPVGWSWTLALFNVQVGNDDEYIHSLAPPGVAGTYSYTSRFSLDGVNWTYCDLDGAGSNPGLTFDAANLGVMTVAP